MRKRTQTAGASFRELTTFGIGGRPVFYSRPPGYGELAPALGRCRSMGLALRVLGGGSNLLADDGELHFGVIHICEPGFDWIERTGPARLRVGAGVRMARLLKHCRDEGLGGLECLAGVPGTLGGALAGNAGAWGMSIADRLASVWTVDHTGNVRERPAQNVTFGYRTSSLAGSIITEAELALERCSPTAVSRRMKRCLRERAVRHPTGKASAGCVFKNPPGASAAKLLDLCGMKGLRVGDAEVSQRHANFICNLQAASARDVLRLIEAMREGVRQRFDVELELELKHWNSQRSVA